MAETGFAKSLPTVADLDRELANRLGRLADAVPLSSAHLDPVHRGAVVARRGVRMAWFTPIAAGLVVIALAFGSNVLWEIGWPTPTDGTIALLTDTSPGGACELAGDSGALARDHQSGIGVKAPDGSHESVMWPFGYTARIRNGRAELLDTLGNVVAVEGDQVAFGGADTGPYWHECGPIELVRPTATSPQQTPGPTPSPEPTASQATAAVSDVASSGPYTLELDSGRAVYHASDPIDIMGTFSYSGASPIDVQDFVPWDFSIDEPVYGMDISEVIDLVCTHATLQPGEHLDHAFIKGGGFRSTDAQAPFKLGWLGDPVLRLPPGTWHIRASSSFTEGTCGDKTISLSTEIAIQVLPDP